jgi:hypothetical protein
MLYVVGESCATRAPPAELIRSGFVGFVANLQRQYLRQQFALFCWVHISLLLIVVSR